MPANAQQQPSQHQIDGAHYQKSGQPIEGSAFHQNDHQGGVGHQQRSCEQNQGGAHEQGANDEAALFAVHLLEGDADMQVHHRHHQGGQLSGGAAG